MDKKRALFDLTDRPHITQLLLTSMMDFLLLSYRLEINFNALIRNQLTIFGGKLYTEVMPVLCFGTIATKIKISAFFF